VVLLLFFLERGNASWSAGKREERGSFLTKGKSPQQTDGEGFSLRGERKMDGRSVLLVEKRVWFGRNSKGAKFVGCMRG